MRALLLNGFAVPDPQSDEIHAILVDELKKQGVDSSAWLLRDTKIAPCQGCFNCWTVTPGVCTLNDAGRDVAREMIQSEVMVFLTPITFGGYSSELKKALDRLIGNITPFFRKVHGEIHHQARYDRYPKMFVIGLQPKADADAAGIFTTLVSRNAINMFDPQPVVGILTREQSSGMLRRELHNLVAKRRETL